MNISAVSSSSTTNKLAAICKEIENLSLSILLEAKQLQAINAINEKRIGNILSMRLGSYLFYVYWWPESVLNELTNKELDILKQKNWASKDNIAQFERELNKLINKRKKLVGVRP